MFMRQISKIYASQITEKVGELIRGIEDSRPGETDVETLMETFINIALPLSILAAGLLMAFAAYKMITSQGNPDKLKDAREQIGNAITGLVFILVSAALLLLIGNIFLP
jgi:hypothetical protein